MKDRKTTIKSVVLIFLVMLSLVLSYLIITYKPDYEIFTKRTTQKAQEADKDNLLSFLMPDTIVKSEKDAREEPIVANSITKVATAQVLKEKDKQKNILKLLSNTESTEARVRNRDIEEVTSNGYEKISINYQIALDSSIIKPLFFSEETSNVSLDFDTIVILKDRPNILYFYKTGDKNYLQVTLKEQVYNSVLDEFNKGKEVYGKYSLNNRFIYLKENVENSVVDEYSAEEVNVYKLAKDIFAKKDNIRQSADNEITDGYSILKTLTNRLSYTNPSNEGGKEVSPITAVSNTVELLELGYAGEGNYQLTTSLEGITIFQEAYKDSIAFSKDGHTDIISEDNSNGIYRLTSPRRFTKTYLSTRTTGLYEVEKTEYVLNYLYSNVPLNTISDIVLGYEKVYNKEQNSFSYQPAWYVKYNERYVSFKKLKEAIDKGGQL